MKRLQSKEQIIEPIFLLTVINTALSKPRLLFLVDTDHNNTKRAPISFSINNYLAYDYGISFNWDQKQDICEISLRYKSILDNSVSNIAMGSYHFNGERTLLENVWKDSFSSALLDFQDQVASLENKSATKNPMVSPVYQQSFQPSLFPRRYSSSNAINEPFVKRMLIALFALVCLISLGVYNVKRNEQVTTNLTIPNSPQSVDADMARTKAELKELGINIDDQKNNLSCLAEK